MTSPMLKHSHVCKIQIQAQFEGEHFVNKYVKLHKYFLMQYKYFLTQCKYFLAWHKYFVIQIISPLEGMWETIACRCLALRDTRTNFAQLLMLRCSSKI